MFRTVKKSDSPNLPVRISTLASLNVRSDTVVFFRVENLKDQQLIVNDIQLRDRRATMGYGPSNARSESLDDYVESCISNREKTIGIDRFFPPTIDTGHACHGYVVISGGQTNVDLVFTVQKANSDRLTKIAHKASLIPPLAAVQITSSDIHTI